MKYPPDFVKRVKEIFPDNEKLHETLDHGIEYAGRYLYEDSRIKMTSAEIVRAFEKGDQQCVLKAAKQAAEREKLHHEWCLLWKAQHP